MEESIHLPDLPIKLSNLPIELLDLIFFHCSNINRKEDENLFIKYGYKEHKQYRYRYIGDMQNGKPHGKGKFNSFHKVLNPNQYSNIEKCTPWLYYPLLEVFNNYKPVYYIESII